MISGKTVALAGICALALCTALAQSASAAFEPATNTTAFECVPEVGAEDFADAHCDEQVGEVEGAYGHEVIPSGATELEITNAETAGETEASTPMVLDTNASGFTISLTAGSIEGQGWIKNAEAEEGSHNVVGELTFTFTEATLVIDGFSITVECEAAEPLEVITKFEGVEKGKKRGLKFAPVEGTVFADFDFTESCPSAHFPINGFLIGTGASGSEAPFSGATTIFEGGGMSEIAIINREATVKAAITMTTADKGGNPIALTSTEDGLTSGTTAFACEEGGGAEDFADVHCDKAVSEETGIYGHKAIASGSETEIELTNAATANGTVDFAPGVFEASVAGIDTKIRSTKYSGTGFLENVAPVEKGHHSVRGEVTMEYRSVHVEEPANCKVASPIQFTSAFESYEEGEAMGIELTPKEGTTFVSLTFEGEECALDGITANVKGSARAIGGAGATAEGSGATAVLQPANESLAVGKGVASIESTLTVRMKEGPPLALTTVE